MNIAVLLPDGTYKTTNNKAVAIHPSSVLCTFGKKEQASPCILFNERIFTTKEYLRTVMNIELNWVKEVAKNYYDFHV